MLKKWWILVLIVIVISGGFYYYFGYNNKNNSTSQINYKFTKDMASEIAYSKTSFNPDEKNRSYNIKIAVDKINNQEIAPNETFSLNKTLGKRTYENGYKEADVILNGDLVKGIGGGVCQVATTLYNAVIKTDCKIVEREHHEFPPTYSEAGQDATIADGEIDLKFKNTTSYPIYINANINESDICISLLSNPLPENRKIEIESELIEVLDAEPNIIIKDDSIKKGSSVVSKKSRKGYKVNVYKNIYDNDKLTERILVSKDTYEPITGITKISS